MKRIVSKQIIIIFMVERYWPNEIPEPSLKGISSSESSSSHDNEEHPLYPCKVWLIWLYDEMVYQGFYTPHVKVHYNCIREKLAEDNHVRK